MSTNSSSRMFQGLKISEKQLATRAQMMLLDPLQRNGLRNLWPSVQPQAHNFINRLYERFLTIPELRAVLQHESRVARLIELQQEYLRQLFCDEIDRNYLERRIAIGVSHHRIRLAPQWYLAAYAHFLAEHVDILFGCCANAEEALNGILVFFKSICFDASLILDAYGMCVESEIFSGNHSDNQTQRDLMNAATEPTQSAPNLGHAERSRHALSRINITPGDAVQRAAFIGITNEDTQNLALLQHSFADSGDEVLDDFYRFIKEDSDLQELVASEDIDRLMSSVQVYWSELLQGRFDEAYAASRMRIGVIHEKIGIEPQFYLAGLSRQVVGYLQRLPSHLPNLQGVLKSFFKALIFDITFVIDAYMDSRSRTLQLAEHHASNLIRGLACSVVIVDAQRRVIFANENFSLLAGVQPAILFRMLLIDALPIEQMHDMIESTTAEDGLRTSRLVSWAGRSLWCTVTKLDQEFPTTRSSMAIVIDDVTDAIAISRELVDDHQRLANLSQTIPVVCWEMDLGTKTIVAVSANVQELTSQRDTSFLGRKSAWFQIIHPDDVDRFFATCSKLIEGQKAICDYRILGPENRIVWVRTILHRLDRPSMCRVSAATIDITQEREADNRRMAAISQISGGIAHAVNNSLTVIMNNLELLSDAPADEELQSLLRQTHVACSRAAATVAQLRTFAGQQVIRPQKCSAAKTASERAELWSRRPGDHIIHCDAADELWDIYIDESALALSLDNLIANALAAMPFGGELTISVRNLLRIEDVEDPGFNREWVEIRVSDTGFGMSDEVRRRAIEPFFSTREVQEAPGLGLSYVYGFVTQSGGHLILDSKPGQGTSVSMRFPKAHGDTISNEANNPKSKSTVLLVDDDELVLASIRRGLEKGGFTVLTAMNSIDALKLLDENRIDSLVADILLREGTDGIQLAQVVAQKHPQAKIVLISGFSSSKLQDQDLPPSWRFIAKPFKMEELASILSDNSFDDSTKIRSSS